MEQRMVEHDYGKYQDDPPPIGDNIIKHLHSLAIDQVAAEALVLSLDEQLRAASEALRELSEKTLPAVMEEINLDTYKTKDGIEIKIGEVVRGSIPKGNETEAFAWLEENNQGRLIKRQFVIEFGKDEERWANKFETDLRRRKRTLAVKRKKGVNPQTLQAFVRSLLAEGQPFPMDVFGIYRQRFTKVVVEEHR
jgi:uncharacterized protein (DUF927 family)